MIADQVVSLYLTLLMATICAIAMIGGYMIDRKEKGD